MENLSINLESLFNEVVEKGRSEGVADFDGFVDMVESVVYAKIAVGEEDQDDPTPGIVDHLKARFDEYLTRIQE